jgi:adenylate kinase
MNPRAIVFFGRSGCGKGTQAKLLDEYLKSKGREVIYVETGSTFRELSKQESLVGRNVNSILTNGFLIPVFLPIWIWTKIIVEKFSGEQDIILDGVCRRKEESVALDSLFDFYNISNPKIILMNVSKQWSYDRMMARQRADDTPEKIQNRLDWYEKDVVPSIDHFRNNPKFNFIEINGEQTIEKVHEDMLKALNL